MDSKFFNWNGIIGAVNDDGDYKEFIHELDIKLKKKYKYNISYYENKNGEKVITHARKIGVVKKEKKANNDK